MVQLRKVVVRTLVLLVVAALWWPLAQSHRVAARQEAAPPVEVGAGPVGEPSLRLVGRLDYLPDRVAMYGFLTAATNLDAAALFTDATPGVASARLTFRAELTIANRETQADVRMLEGDGTLVIFQSESGGALWENPNSFAAGAPIARYAISWRETLQRQDPTIGVVVGDAMLTQDEAEPFVSGGADFRFGNVGIASRLRYTGALVADDGNAGNTASVVGFVSVTEREAIPVPMGVAASP